MSQLTVDTLIKRLQSDSPAERTAAWQEAGNLGAAAIGPLVELVIRCEAQVATLKAEGKMKELAQPLEVGRAAKRALWKIVRTVGAPNASPEAKQAVEEALLNYIRPGFPDQLRRDVLWMLSEIGTDRTVRAIVDLPNILEDTAIRDDARACVQRIGTPYAIEALQLGLEEAKDDFRLAIAESLRALGVAVDPERYPSRKLVPKPEPTRERAG